MYTAILISFVKNTLLFVFLFSTIRIGKSISVQVRPYTIYNHYNLWNIFIPHVAIDVRECDEDTCEINSYGLVSNSKIYSPDILTFGRKCKYYFKHCGENCKPCIRDIPKGYSKKYITKWITIENPNDFLYYVHRKISIYNPLINNCASFVSKAMKLGGENFTCKSRYGIDTPYTCVHNLE